jgi:hypothetical protein
VHSCVSAVKAVAGGGHYAGRAKTPHSTLDQVKEGLAGNCAGAALIHEFQRTVMHEAFAPGLPKIAGGDLRRRLLLPGQTRDAEAARSDGTRLRAVAFTAARAKATPSKA